MSMSTRIKNVRYAAVLLAAPLLAALAGTDTAFAQAALTGPSTVVSPQVGGSNCTTTAGTPCPNSYQLAPSTGTTNTNVTAGPTTYTVADTFNQTRGTSTFSDFGSDAYTSGSRCATSPNCLSSNPLLRWNFQDNYDFTTAGTGPQVQGAFLSFSIPTVPGGGVGLQNVQARIIAFNPTLTPDQLISASGPALTIVDGWQTLTTSGALNLYTAMLNSTVLSANTEYILQVRGEALTAGSYTGSVTFTPVPVPASLVLLLCGLLAVGVLRYWPDGSIAFPAFGRL
jgi:hypothetical protein